MLDLHLATPRVTAGSLAALPGAARRWSEAVWAEAQLAGPIRLDDSQIVAGLEVALRPVFVFGVHRSGTTLVRDLLDGHPGLAVLPSEGTFFTNFEPHLRRLPPGQWLPWLGCEWLRRLANPIHQQPYWLLGRSSQAGSPYITFARTLMAWWPVVSDSLGSTVSSWPIVAVALAYAHCTGGFSSTSRVQRWVEKTPTNERFRDRLAAEFPQARLLHVLRHPCAVYASHKEAARTAGERFRGSGRVLRDLKRSYRIAAGQSGSVLAGRYLAVRYEQLLDQTHATMERLAAFLEIELLPILLQPTAAGLPTITNSSFAIDAEPGRVHRTASREWVESLSVWERARIAATAGDVAASLGYAREPVSPQGAWPIRVAARIVSKLA